MVLIWFCILKPDVMGDGDDSEPSRRPPAASTAVRQHHSPLLNGSVTHNHSSSHLRPSASGT